jgi:hypothetical protein
VPSTLDMQKMGTVFCLRLLEAAVMQSSVDFTTRGTYKNGLINRLVEDRDNVMIDCPS